MKLLYGYSLLPVLFLIQGASWLCAQSASPVRSNLLKVKYTTDFTVTGEGNSENWNNAPWNNLPQHSANSLKNANWNITPDAGNRDYLQYNTSFKILYSTSGIYCLFKCGDSVITATLKGDYLNLYDEDVVEVFLRPDPGMPAYFEYELSPLNFELPILIINNKGDITGWKPRQYEGKRKIKHAVKIYEKKPAANTFTWMAELFIPFALLRPMSNVPPKPGTKWHANFYRIDYDHGPAYFGWQLTRKSFHDPEKFGILEFE